MPEEWHPPGCWPDDTYPPEVRTCRERISHDRVHRRPPAPPAVDRYLAAFGYLLLVGGFCTVSWFWPIPGIFIGGAACAVAFPFTYLCMRLEGEFLRDLPNHVQDTLQLILLVAILSTVLTCCVGSKILARTPSRPPADTDEPTPITPWD